MSSTHEITLFLRYGNDVDNAIEYNMPDPLRLGSLADSTYMQSRL